MESLLIGIISGVTIAVILGIFLYKVLEKSMDEKLHRYMEAVLKYQQSMGNNQIQQIAGLTGKVDNVGTGVANL